MNRERNSSLITHHSSRSEEHTSELQSPCNLVCRLLLEKKKTTTTCEDRVMLGHLMLIFGLPRAPAPHSAAVRQSEADFARGLRLQQHGAREDAPAVHDTKPKSLARTVAGSRDAYCAAVDNPAADYVPPAAHISQSSMDGAGDLFASASLGLSASFFFKKTGPPQDPLLSPPRASPE